MRALFALAATAILMAGAADHAMARPSSSTDEILRANRTVMGGDAWNDKAALVLNYAHAGQGLSGETHILMDLGTGRYVEREEIGPLRSADGFDGNQAWMQDPSGTVNRQDGGDARQLAINAAYRRAHSWWRADRGEATVKNDGTKTENGTTYDVLTVIPKGGKPFNAWFDATTHLLSRIVETHRAVTTTVTYSDYGRQDGVMLAHKRVTNVGSHRYDVTRTLIQADVLPPQPASRFAMPQTRVADYKIGRDASETTIPFRLINNHIYAKVMVNGRGPFRFVFDTGGLNILTPWTAAAVGLDGEGAVPARGAGEHVMKASYTKVKTLGLGEAMIRNQIVAIVPIDKMMPMEGTRLSGMIGFETFRRFVTRIDYGRKTITLIDPKDFVAETAGTPAPFVLNGHLPEIQGRFEGIPARFDIDTGSSAGLILTRPFAQAHALRANHSDGAIGLLGRGVGGIATGYVTEGRSITLGSIELFNVATALADQTQGAFADGNYAGNVGGEVLKHFIVTFDYHHGVMYLKPLAEPDAGAYKGATLDLGGTSDRTHAIRIATDLGTENADRK